MQIENYNSKTDSELTTVQDWLVERLAKQLSLPIPTIKVTQSLTRYGLDSIDAVTMVGDLEDFLDLELSSTLFWDYPTIEKAAQYLEENFQVSAILVKAESSLKN